MNAKEYSTLRRKTLKRVLDAAAHLIEGRSDDMPRRRGAAELRRLADVADTLERAMTAGYDILGEWPDDADANLSEVVHDVQTTTGDWLARFRDSEDAESYREMLAKRRPGTDTMLQGHVECIEVAP